MAQWSIQSTSTFKDVSFISDHKNEIKNKMKTMHDHQEDKKKEKEKKKKKNKERALFVLKC